LIGSVAAIVDAAPVSAADETSYAGGTAPATALSAE
jgi:hypothetical protein